MNNISDQDAFFCPPLDVFNIEKRKKNKTFFANVASIGETFSDINKFKTKLIEQTYMKISYCLDYCMVSAYR